MQIVFRQEVGTEFQVIVEIEGTSSFESRTECRHCGSFGKLPHALNASKLALVVLVCVLGATSTTTVVVVGSRLHVGGRTGMVKGGLGLLVGVKEGRHILYIS